MLEDDGTRLLDVQSTLLSLLHPLVRVSVAVEADGLAGLDIVLQHFQDGTHLVLAGSYLLVHALLERRQGFGHGCVQGYHG